MPQIGKKNLNIYNNDTLHYLQLNSRFKNLTCRAGCKRGQEKMQGLAEGPKLTKLINISLGSPLVHMSELI